MNNKERILFSLVILSVIGLGLFNSIKLNTKNKSDKIEVGSIVKYVGNNQGYKDWFRGRHMKVCNIDNLGRKSIAYFFNNQGDGAVVGILDLKLVR
jgi:hypothetical protein